eukprot:CAMPEP_0114137450 /NCGR_PEP_ID=MMETSP0043_2-20121206/15782_1 /TAXON_ID=464988 /ORGANISM="Hemiselmis andersenii, Strain CCMP644" /LENGTH=325 /DNA_ID=CAMNT_0001231327 /DNA_START=155 /DNA_END=1132 /DNA_ORIENTATION=-
MAVIFLQFLCRNAVASPEKLAVASRPQSLLNFVPVPDARVSAAPSPSRRSGHHLWRGMCMKQQAKQRDRGSKGQQRRDVRVYVPPKGPGGSLAGVGPLLDVGEVVPLDKDQLHYLKKVMRVRDGGEFKLFDGVSGEFWTRLEAGEECGVVTERWREMDDGVGGGDAWVVAAALKNHMELVVQKATELGVSRFQPITTMRTEARRVKTERLRVIAIEAAEQCERLTVPEVMEPLDLGGMLAEWPEDRRLVLCDETGGEPLLSALQDLPPGVPCAYVVGPEGGFDPSELDALRGVPGCVRVSLGSNTLRAETAAISAMAVHHMLRSA